MIVNMACPKCGGQATEYDEKKWSCLRCGNKFVYAPVQPSHTFVQSNVHIQGQAPFELDVANGKSPFPKMVKMIEHDPNCFGKRIEENKRLIVAINRRLSGHRFKRLIALIFIVLMGLVMVMVILAALEATTDKSDDSNSVGLAFVGLVLSGFFMLLPVWAFFYCRNEIRQDNLLIQKLQQTISSLEQQNQMDTRIGDYIICPHCETTLEYVPVDTPLPIEGLKHCLKCGRQFFTSGLKSYPVLFNSSDSR